MRNLEIKANKKSVSKTKPKSNDAQSLEKDLGNKGIDILIQLPESEEEFDKFLGVKKPEYFLPFLNWQKINCLNVYRFKNKGKVHFE